MRAARANLPRFRAGITTPGAAEQCQRRGQDRPQHRVRHARRHHASQHDAGDRAEQQRRPAWRNRPIPATNGRCRRSASAERHERCRSRRSPPSADADRAAAARSRRSRRRRPRRCVTSTPSAAPVATVSAMTRRGESVLQRVPHDATIWRRNTSAQAVSSSMMPRVVGDYGAGGRPARPNCAMTSNVSVVAGMLPAASQADDAPSHRAVERHGPRCRRSW